MSIDDLNGYVLVKDKDGNLKYYKDGKFFSVEEIAKTKKIDASPEQKKTELKPVFSYKAPQLSDKKDDQKTIGSHSTRVTGLGMAEVDEAPINDELLFRRNEDQNIINKRVEEVIAKLKIKFSDPEVEKRFRNFLTTFFRGVRTAKELTYMLELPRANGGLELPKEKVGLIVSVLEHTALEINRERRNIAAIPKEKIAAAPTLDTSHELMSPPPVIIPKPVETAKVVGPSPKAVEAKRSIAPAIMKPIVERPKSQVNPAPAAKPRLEDVKPLNRLVGPVEELQIMTLNDFRGLGKNAGQIVSALLEKFQVLKAQSLRSLTEGQAAWKKSLIFQLYLTMIFQSIKEKKSMEKVIEERQTENKEVLTFSEYEALADLNRKIGEY